MKRLLIFFTGFLLCQTLHAQITTLLATNTGDSYTNSGSSATNYGTSTTASVQVSSGYTRSFFKFDLSSIPFGAVIYSATLTLTPNGSEGVDVTNSSFVLERVVGSWIESGTSSITDATAPAVTTSGAVTASTVVSGKRVFNVRALVSTITALQAPNYGWRIRRSNELTATASNSYYTKEDATVSNRPVLDVKWYLPFEVGSAVIVHTSELTATDGSISPTLINGTGLTKTYQWYKSDGTPLATTPNLSGVGYGWYGLRVTTTGFTGYYAFIVGVENQAVDITFKVAPEYSDEAFVYNRNTGGVDYANSNNDNYPYYYALDWGTTGDWYEGRFLVRYNLWMDPLLTVHQSDLHLQGYSHYSALRTNGAEVKNITQQWRENFVTYNNAPTVGTTTETVAATTTTTQNAVIDLNDYWNAWKNSNTTNYGIDLRLSLYNGVRARQQYYSSNSAESLRPYIQFNVEHHHALTPLSLGYYQLKDEFDGGYAQTAQGKLKIYFTEEYHIESNKYLPLKIYDASHVLKASVDLDGNVTTAGTPLLPYGFNDNRYQIDLTPLSLHDGEMYTLEVRTSTGEKKFLKFLYQD